MEALKGGIRASPANAQAAKASGSYLLGPHARPAMARHAFNPPCGFDLAATTIEDLEDVARIASWGYRLVLHPDGTLFLHEAYYDEGEALLGFATPPTRLCGETVETIREELRWMREALDEPPLRYADFGAYGGRFTRYGWEGEDDNPAGPPTGPSNN